MKRKTLLSICLILFVTGIFTNNAMAVSAYTEPVKVSQPDGSFITVIMQGDEKVSWAQTLDGYTILVNNKGVYEYAIANNDGGITLSGIAVSDVSKRTKGESDLLSTLQKGLRFSESQVSVMRQVWDIKKTESTKAFPTTGNRKLICILMGFKDRAFTKSQSEFNNLFNQVNYTTGGATGSVKDFYLESSYGQFTLDVTVAGPYTSANNMSYYGAGNPDANPRALVTEAINAADASVNFANFDNDNDGTVDGVYIIYAGYGEEAGGGSNAIWAHAWSITPVTKDGKSISKYSCSAELRGSSGSTITAIGVICHEFGHVLGAPDYYDTDYATGGQFDGTGKWDMMANGSWNNNGVTPAQHNAYTKIYYYNWATPTTLTSATNVTVTNSNQNKSFYRINSTTTNEFWLMENRQQVGFDAQLPGHGLIIYHVHSGIGSVGNSINATYPQRMYPVCASATSNPGSTASTYGTINGGGCPFPGTSGKTSFTDATTPSMKSWAGANTNKPITNISESSQTITFSFMGGGGSDTQAPTTPTNLASSNITSSSVTLSWTASTDNVGVDHYTVYNGSTAVGNTSSTSYNVTGLAASTNYSFTVKAFDAANNASNASTAKSVTTLGSSDTESPTNPTNLAFSNVTSSGVNLSWAVSTDNVGVDHYTVYKNGVSVGNSSTNSYSVTGLSASTTYSFTVKAFDAAGNASGASNAVSVSTGPDSGGEYCAASGNDFSYEWISKVVLNGQTKSSNAAGYSDFTATTITLATGSNSVTLTPGFSSSSYNESWKIWIDFNGDKDFDDAGEQLFSQSGSAAVSGTITIPTSASGQTRMRIAMRYNAAPATCGSFDYGEVEDYTVSFSGGGNDIDAPTTPRNLAASNITSSSIGLSWTASTDNVGVTGYDVYQNGSLKTSVTGSSATITGLAASTTYSFYVKAKDAAGNISAASNTVVVTTSGGTVAYCTSKGSNSSYFWINYVGLNNMTNTSGNNNGYADFTSKVANITSGASSTLYLQSSYSYTVYTVYWAIWIDYNQNGTFETTEKILSGSTATSSQVSGAFTVPTSALAGNTRMRVSMKYSSEATSCETFSYGEVEDYTVNISGQASGNYVASNGVNELGNASDAANLYPVPAKTVLNVEFNAELGSDVQIYSVTGAVVKSFKATSNIMQINVSDLAPGLYFIKHTDGLGFQTNKFIIE